MAKNSDLAGRLIESIGHSRRIVESQEDTPQLLQKADGRSDAQEGQSENRTDGLSHEIIPYVELAERCPMTTRHLVTRMKQQRLPDSYESRTCDLEPPNRRMAPHTKVPPRYERSPRR